MTDQQKEIIKRLYENKAITFDEALELCGKCDTLRNKDDNFECLLPIQNDNNITFEKLLESCYEDVLESFRVKECVEFMHNVGWTWAFHEVNEEGFKNFIKSEISRILKEMLLYIKESGKTIDELKQDDKEFSTSCGGFESFGYFDTDSGMPVITVNFTASSGCSFCEQFNHNNILDLSINGDY